MLLSQQLLPQPVEVLRSPLNPALDREELELGQDILSIRS
jgi:hypothetical protein